MIEPETRQNKYSVTKDDDSGRTMSFIFPMLGAYGAALPPVLPDSYTNGYNDPRDILLLSTPKFESQWANAQGIAVSTIASKGFEVDSEIPLRRKNAHSWLLEAGAGNGLYGFVPFLTASLRSYLNLGISFIEIERTTQTQGGKVVNIHALNPLRCRLTGDSYTPVHYMSDHGDIKPLKWWQVMVITDMPHPYIPNCFEGATERAYLSIVKLAGIETAIYEEVTGRTPSKLSFLGGITKRAIDDITMSAQHEADKKGLRSYMGAAVVGVPGDAPLTLVEVNLKDLPKFTNVKEERERADLIYANAIGLDPQDVNPAIIGRQGNGSTGNQSAVLANKRRGRGLAKYAQELSHNLNQLALDDATSFAFIERDLADEKIQAQNKKTRGEWRKTMIDAGEITPAQSKNLAVDDGDLPREYSDIDITGADKLRDDEKPLTPAEVTIQRQRPQPEEEPEAEATEKQVSNEWIEVYH